MAQPETGRWFSVTLRLLKALNALAGPRRMPLAAVSGQAGFHHKQPGQARYAFLRAGSVSLAFAVLPDAKSPAAPIRRRAVQVFDMLSRSWLRGQDLNL